MNEEVEARRSKLLAELVAHGWKPASEPPDSDRTVRVVYDDGGRGLTALAFWDDNAQIPGAPHRWWSASDARLPLPDGLILAWREKDR